MQGLEQFGLRVHILIDGERRAVQLQSLVVVPRLDETVTLAAHPVGLVLLHTSLLRERDRLVEVLDRLVDLAKSEAAQGDVAVILAHRLGVVPRDSGRQG